MKEKKNTYIKFVDEDNTTSDGWFDIVEKNTGYITFLTLENKITIPMHRIIKIKETPMHKVIKSKERNFGVENE